MGLFEKIKKGVEHAVKEGAGEAKKAGEAVANGVEHAVKEGAGEAKKAGEAIANGVEHAVVEFHEEFIESHGSGETSPDSESPSSEKSGVILIISGSGVGCGVTVENLDTGKKGEHKEPGARDCSQCRNVFDVAFERAGIESVCQVASCELWVSTRYKWTARHYGPSVTHKSN